VPFEEGLLATGISSCEILILKGGGGEALHEKVHVGRRGKERRDGRGVTPVFTERGGKGGRKVRTPSLRGLPQQ